MRLRVFEQEKYEHFQNLFLFVFYRKKLDFPFKSIPFPYKRCLLRFTFTFL